MRNIEAREGYEFWDKICAVQSYAFLLSPDGRRVVKTPDVGDWIDKHDAQVIVDHAQEEINAMKAELACLAGKLETFYSRSHGIKNLSAIETLNDQLEAANQKISDLEKKGWYVDDCGNNRYEPEEKLSAAQSELAALREELARYQAGHEALYDRMTAAEQRNAELVELLGLIKRSYWTYASWENFSAQVDALRPTESGASHVDCGQCSNITDGCIGTCQRSKP